jgi:hypothetical protein
MFTPFQPFLKYLHEGRKETQDNKPAYRYYVEK